MQNAYAWDVFGHEVNVDTGDVASLAVGAAVAGAVIIAAPIEVPALAVAGVAIAGGIAANYIYRTVTGKDSNNAVTTGGKDVTTDDLNKSSMDDTIGKTQSYSDADASKDLLLTRQAFASKLVTHSFQFSGSTADIHVEVKAPDKIMGFSPFPVQVILHGSVPSDPPQSCIHIQSVKVYVVDEEGRLWSKDEWNGDLVLRHKSDWYPDALGTSYVFNFTLDAPDPYLSIAKKAATSGAGITTKELDELVHAKTKKFETIVEVKGYRELWRWESVAGCRSDSYIYEGTDIDPEDKPIGRLWGDKLIASLSASDPPKRPDDIVAEWHPDPEDDHYGSIYSPARQNPSTVDLSVNGKTLSIYNAVHDGTYYLNGQRGSYPADFGTIRELLSYACYCNGATSILVGRIWATPVHVFDSTADYKVAIITCPENMLPLNISVYDDYRFLVMRSFTNGVSAIAWQVPGSFNGVIDPNFAHTQLGGQSKVTVKYTHDTNTVAYDVYYVMFGTIKLHNTNGIVKERPYWFIIKPDIGVLDNNVVSLSDEVTNKVIKIVDDSRITQDEANTLKQLADTATVSLEKKKSMANDFANRYKDSNENASYYAEQAVKCYDKAIEHLKSIEGTADANDVKRHYKLAEDYERAGDYFYDAAQKAAFGKYDQAKASVDIANKFLDDAKQYEPSMFFTTGSWLGDAWQQFKAGFGISNIPDWVLILVVVILVVGGAVIVLKLF